MAGPAKTKSEVALENKFTSVSKSADPKLEGRSITQAALEAWVVLHSENQIGKADLDAAFQKLGKRDKPGMTFTEFSAFISEVAKAKGLDEKALKDKLLKPLLPK